MADKIVFLFSGQGSQYRRMGERLYEKNKIFKARMDEMNEQVLALSGISIIDRLYGEQYRGIPFDALYETHPAIFMVEHALDEALREEGIFPDIVAGASMGELAAAVSAGIISRGAALGLLVEMAGLTERLCPQGGMLAVFADAQRYEHDPVLRHNSELAGVNYDAHFVVTGSRQGLEVIENHLRAEGVLYQHLPVRYAFHSGLMKILEEPYRALLGKLACQPPRTLYFSCQTGRSMQHQHFQQHFWNVLRQPILFAETFAAIERLSPCTYIDLGPSGTLNGFVTKLLPSESASGSFRIMTPFHQDSIHFAQTVDYLKKKKGDSSMLAYIFPGQGAQKVGMAAGLFDLFPEREAQADSILGYSIRTLCQEDPDRKLNQTEYTQPALYVVNALLYEKTIKETGRKPDVVAGHSLGEYNALLAAGVFDFDTGLRLVQKRGELMSRMSGGGMLAIVGLTESSVRKILQDNGMDSIDIANLNAPKQIVLAGPKEDIPAAQAVFEREGAELVMPLRVSGAFHSRYMAGARKEFEAVLRAAAFHRPQITVICNVTARPCTSEEDITRLLGEQLTSSVKWTETVQVLLGMGAQEIVELGPGTVLTKLVSKIREEALPIKLEDKLEDSTQACFSPEEKNGGMVQPEALGNPSFLEDYGAEYAYVAGAMYKGIASEAMVIKLGKSGILSFFGSGGLKRERIEGAIRAIKAELRHGEPFGMNFLHNASSPAAEMELADLYLEQGIRCIEASAFMGITPALVLFRAKGLRRMADGTIYTPQKIMAKISRPEIADMFMRPAPKGIVEKLLQENRLTATEAELIGSIPMADDICAEADSGGHTDHAVALALLPSILELRKGIMNEYKYAKPIRVGAAGGIGTPGAAASMFVMGADFIMTGSINQCTVEAGTSPLVKDMLNQMNVQDTESAPAGDMFEIGARVQVLKKGLFFPARANKLYELYRQFDSLDELDHKTRQQLQERYFKRSFEEVFEEVKTYQPRDEIEKAERNPKHKLALVFKWYFGYSTRAAMQGAQEDKVNFQIHCGPALGAFNQWAKGTALESWRNRHVDEIGIALMKETAALLSDRLLAITAKS